MMKHVGRWTAALAALAVGVGVAPAAAKAPPPKPESRTRPAGALMPFRVDVSRRPEIGLVVTVTGAPNTLASKYFSVKLGLGSEQPSVRPLSPQDVQLVISPDVHVRAPQLQLERAAVAAFLARLPPGAQTAVASFTPLSSDPSGAIVGDLELGHGPWQSAARRLTLALAAFSSGASVRRTVVLVVTANEQVGPPADRALRRRLAASGTALYVVDASPHGAPAVDALATGSGGFAARVGTSADWRAALGRITADLNHQYYLRFSDSAPLPGSARIVVRTPSGPVTGVASLPSANPTAPPIVMSSRPSRPNPSMPLSTVALIAVALVIAYGLAMLVASRREPRSRSKPARRPASPSAASSLHANDLFFVFLLPCLNEEKVIRNSLERLLSFDTENFAVMVIDDGSDDDTAGIVSTMADDRVWLLRRALPHAREGKGEALNAAIAELADSAWLRGRDPEKVIVVVVDADGRVDPHSLSAVTPYFADPTVGAVQIGVRINNRAVSRLARMQDMEFVIYTEVFQRGRRHLGSVGLGGNGQFMRLAALRSLGKAPWSRSLTEDLDLGIRLLTAGWQNEFCHTAAVHQQGVIELRRLVRQRSRWFQGHLQSWRLIPTILRSAPNRARADLLYHLSSPAILLIASLLTASFISSLLASGVVAANGGNPLGWWVLSTYALAFGPALLYSYTYWLQERENGISLTRTAGLAHLYVCYCLMWYAAGWWAVGRTLRRRTNWTKTDRTTEAPLAVPGAQVLTRLLSAPSALPVLAMTAPHQPMLNTARRFDTSRRRTVGRYRVAPPTSRTRRGRLWCPGPRMLAVTAVLVCLLIGAGLLVVNRPGESRLSQWYQVFSGYGNTTVSGSGKDAAITLSVATTHSPRETHAALVLSRKWYGDFVATARVQTIRQLRRGVAGPPNPWEVGWVVWHYSSPQHFYALTLESRGWVLSKQDPRYPGSERFLASGKLPFPVGAAHHVGIVQIGDQITVSAGGHLLTRFVDTQRPYLTGGFGIYTEDSVARFSDLQFQPLSSTTSFPANIKPNPASVTP